MAIAVAICVVGIYSFRLIPVNLLPDITYPLVRVNVTWAGATPEEIENNIAEIIEPRMATVDNLDYLETSITEGSYQLQVNFSYDTDRDIAYQDVLAKIGLVRKRLPKDADEPLITKADPSQMAVMELMVTSDKWDMVKLRSWVENELQYDFSSIEGTAGTDIAGGKKREIRILVDPHRLETTGITLDKIAQKLADENIELSAGRLTTGNKEFTVRSLSRIKSIEEISNIVLESDKYGAGVTLSDVATIKDDSEIQRVKAFFNGIEGVRISVTKNAANTIYVEEKIPEKLLS
jgi:multidrug efflux pump subunit AcrB